MKLSKRTIAGLALLALPAFALAKDDATTRPSGAQTPKMQLRIGGDTGDWTGLLQGAGAGGNGGAFVVPLQAQVNLAKREKAAYLGVSVVPAGEVLAAQLKLPDNTGLTVNFVDPEGPAKAAGIQPNDVLTKLNDQILVDTRQLTVLVRTNKPGDEVKLTLIRQGQPQTLSVKLVEKEVFGLGANEWFGGDGEPTRVPLVTPVPFGASAGYTSAANAAAGLGETNLVVNENGTTAELRQNADGMTMTITQNGDAREYKAANAEELQKKDPAAYNLYKQYFGEAEQVGALARNALVGKTGANKLYLNLAYPTDLAIQLPDGVDSQQMNFKDGITLTLSRDADGKTVHLLAKDNKGVLFDGPVSTQEQRKAIPKNIADKLTPMLAGFTAQLLEAPPPVLPGNPAREPRQ